MSIVSPGNLVVVTASRDTLDVRQFAVQERMSTLFTVTLVVTSENPDIELDAIVGQPARFTVRGGARSLIAERTWSGVCSRLQQLAVEETGVSTYHLTIVPSLWLATQRRNHRMFQHISELDIALQILADWGVTPLKHITSEHKKRKYRVQYGESDFAFFSRMLEDAGISFHFQDVDGESTLVLSDAPQAAELRAAKIPFVDKPTSSDREHVTAVRVDRKVKPGRFTIRDHDYRKPPAYKLTASAATTGVEERLESFEYSPGAFLFGNDRGEATPFADDRGKARTDEAEGAILAQKRLDARRGSATTCVFETNALDLAPGVVVSFLGHPRRDLGETKRLLIVESSISGTPQSEWIHHCEARSADSPYRPELVTPRPRVSGVESATVVGPADEEIHCDEFGRVRVHFHWDRESGMNERSSCWIHVSQSWGGGGFGGMNLPRIGQEVLIDFLGGDPDRPVIVGRIYTNLQKVPYTLPANKTQSGWKSNSTGGGGGFNEVMFEDAVGKELLRMQAEKDLHKLVKNDEHHAVGRDRTRGVKRNESVTIGKHRTKHVKQNERVIIGQTQSVTVGINRSAHVGMVDSTTAGTMHVVSIAPATPGGPTTSVTMMPQIIMLSTGAGATITMAGSDITLSAATISLKATGDLTVKSDGGEVRINGGPLVKINT
jgi:type VI secretion system secreted protein VgrG